MYGRIFESMYTGSMVGLGPIVFSLWPYVIAHTKPPGVVEINPKVTAAIIGCTEEQIAEAIEILCSVDPNSRSLEHEGRRLIRTGQFLYDVPTWSAYRAMDNNEERRAYNRDAKRRSRAKKSLTVNDMSRSVSTGQQRSATVSTCRMQDAHTPTVPAGGTYSVEGVQGESRGVAPAVDPVPGSPKQRRIRNTIRRIYGAQP